MNSKEILIYILGYLESTKTLKRIPYERINPVKKTIVDFNNLEIENEKKKLEIENQRDKVYEDYECDNFSNDYFSLNNNPNYNPEFDIDQQSPDFEF